MLRLALSVDDKFDLDHQGLILLLLIALYLVMAYHLSISRRRTRFYQGGIIDGTLGGDPLGSIDDTNPRPRLGVPLCTSGGTEDGTNDGILDGNINDI